MEFEQIAQYALSILSGLAVTIPLVIELIKYVQMVVRERNWSKLLKMIMEYMETAEAKFETGAEKKEWVISMIETSSDVIDYDVDMELVSQMIDRLCDMSKVVNPPSESAT